MNWLDADRGRIWSNLTYLEGGGGGGQHAAERGDTYAVVFRILCALRCELFTPRGTVAGTHPPIRTN